MSRQKDRFTFTVNLDGRVYECDPPAFEGAAFVIARGGACPLCGKSGVAGAGRRIEGHATYAADGGCADCRKVTGVLRVVVAGTLFGLEEDERVASMGVRIY